MTFTQALHVLEKPSRVVGGRKSPQGSPHIFPSGFCSVPQQRLGSGHVAFAVGAASYSLNSTGSVAKGLSATIVSPFGSTSSLSPS